MANPDDLGFDDFVQEGNLDSILNLNKQLKAKKMKLSNSSTSNLDAMVSEEDSEELSSLEDEDNSLEEILSDNNVEEMLPSKKNKIGLKNNTAKKTQPVNSKLNQKRSHNKSKVNQKNVNQSKELIKKTINTKNGLNNNKIKAQILKLADHNTSNVNTKPSHKVQSENSLKNSLSDKTTHKIISTLCKYDSVAKNYLSSNKTNKNMKKKKSVTPPKEKKSDLYNYQPGNSSEKRKSVASIKLNKSHIKINSTRKTVNKLKTSEPLQTLNKPKKQSVNLSLVPQFVSPKRKSIAMEKLVKTPHPIKAKLNVGSNQKGLLPNRSSKQIFPILDKSVETKQLSVSPFRKKPRHRLLKKLAASK